MKSFVCKLVFPLLAGLAVPSAASAQAASCDKDLAACIARAAAETAAFVEECGKLYPESKPDFDAALAQWSVRRLKIPGVEEALRSDALGRVGLAKKASSYMKSVGSYQREIECTARMAMLKSKEPRLRADFVSLPPDPLERYIK
jgi:hypothetical protein